MLSRPPRMSRINRSQHRVYRSCREAFRFEKARGRAVSAARTRDQLDAIPQRPGAERLMELIRPDVNFDFIGKAPICAAISLGLVLISLALMVRPGFSWGIDFVGGTVIEVDVPEDLGDVDEGRVRGVLSRLGFPDAVIVRLGRRRRSLISHQRQGVGGGTSRPLDRDNREPNGGAGHIRRAAAHHLHRAAPGW